MKIKLGKKIKNKQLKNCFVFEIETMQGDADDYHKFTIIIDKKDIKNLIIYCNVLEKSYPNGKGGPDGFDKLDFFADWFEDDWYIYEDFVDEFENFDIYYYDKNGGKRKVSYKLSKKDKKKIDSYPVLA